MNIPHIEIYCGNAFMTTQYTILSVDVLLYLNNSPIWLSEEVPVSLFQPTQVQGVDCHMCAGLALWWTSTLLWRVFTGCCRAWQWFFCSPDIVINYHLIKQKGRQSCKIMDRSLTSRISKCTATYNTALKPLTFNMLHKKRHYKIMKVRLTFLKGLCSHKKILSHILGHI